MVEYESENGFRLSKLVFLWSLLISFHFTSPLRLSVLPQGLVFQQKARPQNFEHVLSWFGPFSSILGPQEASYIESFMFIVDFKSDRIMVLCWRQNSRDKLQIWENSNRTNRMSFLIVCLCVNRNCFIRVRWRSESGHLTLLQAIEGSEKLCEQDIIATLDFIVEPGRWN